MNNGAVLQPRRYIFKEDMAKKNDKYKVTIENGQHVIREVATGRPLAQVSSNQAAELVLSKLNLSDKRKD